VNDGARGRRARAAATDMIDVLAAGSNVQSYTAMLGGQSDEPAQLWQKLTT